MGNHTVKKEAAGLRDKTFIVGMQINQKVKEIGENAKGKTLKTFELDAKGKLYREVVPTEYMVIKAYSNKVKDEKTNAAQIKDDDKTK